MSTISEVISFRGGKVIASTGDGADLEILQGDATVVPELTRYVEAPAAEFAFAALKRATLEPDLFRWVPFKCENPVLTVAELAYEARSKWCWPCRVRGA